MVARTVRAPAPGLRFQAKKGKAAEPKPAENKPEPPPVAVQKEPEKPRAVVDVYRGDKHVQELFR